MSNDIQTIKWNRGTTFAFALEFVDADGAAIDVSNQKLLLTIVSAIDDDDSDAVVSKSYTIPADADAIAGIYNNSLTPTDMSIPVGTYYMNYRLVGDVNTVSDSDTIRLKIEQAPTTRVA